MCLSEPLGQEGTTSEAYPPWHGHRKSCFTLICRIGGFCFFFVLASNPLEAFWQETRRSGLMWHHGCRITTWKWLLSCFPPLPFEGSGK